MDPSIGRASSVMKSAREMLLALRLIPDAPIFDRLAGMTGKKGIYAPQYHSGLSGPPRHSGLSGIWSGMGEILFTNYWCRTDLERRSDGRKNAERAFPKDTRAKSATFLTFHFKATPIFFRRSLKRCMLQCESIREIGKTPQNVLLTA
jgi:hypothetical protein